MEQATVAESVKPTSFSLKSLNLYWIYLVPFAVAAAIASLTGAQAWHY
jgi:hypothetical protein